MAILTLLCVLLSPQSSAVEAWSARRAADAHYDGRDWSAAAASYGGLLEAEPLFARWDGELWRRAGVAWFYAGEHGAALEAFEAAARLGVAQPARLHFAAALAAARAGELDAGFDALDATLAARFEERSTLELAEGLASLRDDARWAQRSALLPSGEWERDDGLRFDLAYLVREARRMHAGPARPAFSAEFEAAAARLHDVLPALDDDAALCALLRLVALLDDGHSTLFGPGEDTPLALEGRVLPLDVYAFEDGLFVIDGVGEWAELAGSRILRYGDVSAEEVLSRLAALRGVDNPMTWRWMGPEFYLRRLALLRHAGVEDRDGQVPLTLQAPGESPREVSVPAGQHGLVRKLRPSPAAQGPVPLWLSDLDSAYWIEPLPELDAVYVQFNSVRDAGAESLAGFAGRVRDACRSEGTALIVDVRHNNGGNNGLLRPLLRVLVEFDLRSDGPDLFVLTGRNTFSAAQNFINRVERWTDAIFVGEPSSSSPNFVGEEAELVLPYSRIVGSLSTRYWQDSDPGDERPWITPHVPVALDSRAYFTGRDPALEAIFEVLEAR